MAKRQPRAKNKDNARRSKKKVSLLTQEKVEYVDYKDVNLLRRFMSDRAKVRARRVTGNDAQQQREVARAIKSAREMALLPYTNRVTTQRTSKDRDRGGRADAPPPRPTADTPPPTGGDAPAEDGDVPTEDGDVSTEDDNAITGEGILVDGVEQAPVAEAPPADEAPAEDVAAGDAVAASEES
jgi:small subunit ribosomal protein S18